MEEPMEDKVRRVIDRFIPEPGGTHYAITDARGEPIIADFPRADLPRIKQVVSSLAGVLKPDEFMFMGGKSGGTLLIYRASDRIFVALEALRGAPGIMLSCARSIYGELKEQLAEAKALAPAVGEAVYELNPKFSSPDEALKTVPASSFIARNIVANLDRPLTAREITAGLKSMGIETTYEEVLSVLEFLEVIGVVRKREG